VFELVSAELCLEFVEYLSREQTEALLNEIAVKTGVKWIESSENFILSGTFKQVYESRAYLQQGARQSNGIVVLSETKREAHGSQSREDSKSHLDDDDDNEEDVNQNSQAAVAPKEGSRDRPPVGANKVDIDDTASSASPEIQSFEIEPKVVKAFIRAYEKDLDDIEAKYQVEVPRIAEGSKFSLKPKTACSAAKYDEACNRFITLYQKMYQLVKMERISLKSESHIMHARQAISRMGKNFPISVERSKDHRHWELYGEASYVEEALKYLEQDERVEIQRETENNMDKNSGRKKPKDDEEDMDVDPPEYSSSTSSKTPGNKLETFLGKVKVSVYKGDITNENVDVIVNAANRGLDHNVGVAKAILDKGGKSIRNEFLAIIKQRGSKLKDGDAVTTKSGKLRCEAIVHAVGPKCFDLGAADSKKILRRACLNSFLEAEKLDVTSIALPAIGSGVCGMPKDVCAEVMFDAVDEFVRQGDPKKKTITDVRFVNIDDPTVEAFGKEFMARHGNNREKKIIGEGSTRFPPTGVEGGSSTRSRPNRGRNRNKTMPNNNRSTTNPRDTEVSQHHHTSFGSSAANIDHPLRASGHSTSPDASYSGAVKRHTGASDAIPPKGDEPRGPEGKSGFSVPRGGKTEEKGAVCPICLDTMVNPRALKCKHVFCSGCLQSALDVSNRCPVCQEPQGVLQGNQPRGEMTFHFERHRSVPGYEGCGTIVIQYRFPQGVQGKEHPNPGQRYDGTSRTAYLPDTREGREVLHLLRRAFDARLVFTVGTSSTTGLTNQITWNDIHHKTNIYGGPYGFGYPDPDYLRRVKEELAAKGIR